MRPTRRRLNRTRLRIGDTAALRRFTDRRRTDGRDGPPRSMERDRSAFRTTIAPRAAASTATRAPGHVLGVLPVTERHHLAVGSALTGVLRCRLPVHLEDRRARLAD